MTLADQIVTFLKTLKTPAGLPDGVEVLNPYKEAAVLEMCEKFYHKYYGDDAPRTLILGINPGRFGGGVTGIPFSDPIRLEKECGLPNDFLKKPELSSGYIYQMINAYGGPKKFYSKFYISSVSPLGFTKAGKNLNYYDIPALQEKLMPFILRSMTAQLNYPLRTDICYCLGEGDNFKFIKKLNDQHTFFENVVPLAHPRFILQYRRKQVDDYIRNYVEKLAESTAK